MPRMLQPQVPLLLQQVAANKHAGQLDATHSQAPALHVVPLEQLPQLIVPPQELL